MKHKAVRQDLNLNFFLNGRKPPKGLDEAGIAVDLDAQIVDNAVVRPSFLVEILVCGRYFVQGIGQVERLLRFLCIQEDGELIGLRDDIHHTLVLNLIVFVEEGLFHHLPLKVLFQFGLQVPEHFGNGLPIHNGQQRYAKDKSSKG